MPSWESFGSIMEVFEGCNILLKVLILESWGRLDIVVEKGRGAEELNMEEMSVKEVSC